MNCVPSAKFESRRKGAGKAMMHRIFLPVVAALALTLAAPVSAEAAGGGGGQGGLGAASEQSAAVAGALALVPVPEAFGNGSFTGNLGSSRIGHGGASFSTGSYGSMGHLDIGHGDIGLNLTLVVPGKRVIPPGCPEASGVLRCFRQWILGHDTHERKD